MSAGQTASLKPSTFVAGGGLVSDVDVVFGEIGFCMWDYNGAVPTANPAIKAKLLEEDGTEHEQYWSMGNAKDWAASQDGKKLVAVGNAVGLNESSNGALLLASIINSGFPEDKLGDDITVLQGMKAHVIRQAPPKRNLQPTERADGRKYDPTVLVVSKILQLPWEKGKGKTKAATTTTQAPADSGNGADLTEQAQGVVMEILTAEGKAMPKQQLVTKVFQAVKSDPNRNKIVNLCHTDEFLSNGPWEYKGGMVGMG